jgi:Flp pilus assembly protein TadD
VTPPALRTQLDDGILAFTLGDSEEALRLLQDVVAQDPTFGEAWLALAEVHFAGRDYDAALAAGRQAAVLKPEDVHVHTTLSRIWMERGDKAQAEHHGAQARLLSWKAELREPPGP